LLKFYNIPTYMAKTTSEQFAAFLVGATPEESEKAWDAYTGDPNGDFVNRVSAATEALLNSPAEVVALAGLDNAARAKAAVQRFKQDPSKP
jgi:hypothetical protein